jgi:hypothetical protein
LTYQYIRRQHERVDRKRFDALVAMPHDLETGDLDMPANGRLAVSHSVGVTEGQLSLTVNGEDHFTPDLTADEVWRLDYVERARAVNVETLVPGEVTVYLVDPFGRHLPIATRIVGGAELLIHDEFDGAAGTELNGRAPDTINTPGNLWTVEANDELELDGSGAVRGVSATAPHSAQIDSGVVSNLQAAEIFWSTAGGGGNLTSAVFILADGAWNAGAGGDPNDYLMFLRGNTSAAIHEVIGGSVTVLATQAAALTVRTGETRRIENDAGTIRVYEGGVEIAGLATAYSVPAGLDGNPFMGFSRLGTFLPTALKHRFRGYDNA